MTQLIIFLAIGSILLVFGLFALVRIPKENAGKQESTVPLINIVALPSLEFKNPSVIFSAADYRTLSSDQRLQKVARQLWTDRRRIALHWLKLLQADVVSLWHLRRLLTSYGVSQGLREELAATLQILMTLLFLTTLRVFVFLFGPFACAGIAFSARRHADGLFHGCRAALGHLPESRWIQFADEWRTLHVPLA